MQRGLLRRMWAIPLWLLCVTAPAAAQTKIGWGSCIQDPDTGIWEQIRRHRPEAFLLVGDTIYLSNPDWGSAETLALAYERQFRRTALGRAIKAIPTYAVWDDHDFGPGNSDSLFQGAHLTRAAFRRQWPGNPPPPPGLESSVAFELRVGQQVTVLMTDNRTYRVNPGTRGKRPRMFGKRQMEWITSRLAAPETPFIVLASGGQLLSQAGDHESLLQYDDERRALYDALAGSPAEVLILSGDLHYGEILSLRIGERTIVEATSSPLAARIRSQIRSEPARRALVDTRNFGIAEFDPGKRSVNVRLIDETGRVRASETVEAAATSHQLPTPTPNPAHAEAGSGN